MGTNQLRSTNYFWELSHYLGKGITLKPRDLLHARERITRSSPVAACTKPFSGKWKNIAKTGRNGSVSLRTRKTRENTGTGSWLPAASLGEALWEIMLAKVP